MATITEPRSSELEALESSAADHLGAEEGRLQADLERAADRSGDGPEDDDDAAPAGRLALAVAFPVLGAAIMVGGAFSGVTPRLYAAAGGLLGIGLALLARRIPKPVIANTTIVTGLFAIGLGCVATTGIGNVASVRDLAGEAAAAADLTRPPVDFIPGWTAILGWLMGIVGFIAAWVATVLRRPSLALLVPLPVAAFAGISVPEGQQQLSGIVVLLLFAVSLGVLSSAQATGEGGEPLPASYEIRKGLKALPVLAAITAALFALSQTSFLFPPPFIDPAQEPQKPQTTPLTEVEDRVLFSVTDPEGGEPRLSGPWRIGSLDVYDGTDWRLPPFDENQLADVPDDGIVDRSQLARRGLSARFKVAGLGGAVLPGLPNTVGVIADGPKLSYDARNGNIRLAGGEVPVGLTYTVVAAALPSVDELRAVTAPLPEAVQPFVDIPDPPPAVRALLDEADAGATNAWDRFDFLRTYVLDEVVATGLGEPVSIPPERVQEILGTTLEASPYEIVALQALLARWAGVPSRIGYGYDQGELVDEALEVRPRNGASFVEVFFPGFGWLPVIGTPRQAQPTVGSDPGQQQVDPNIVPSDDITIELFLPTIIAPGSIFAEQLQRILLIGVPLALLLLLVYVAAPGVRKAVLRTRRRAAARAAGPRARIALAYAEWRDAATDYGYPYPDDTPLMYLDRFADDAEHSELAWLTTRALWGDLRDEADAGAALATSAEELSRALQRRLAAAQPATLRAVARVSRLSLRRPYAPATDLRRRAGRTGVLHRREATTDVATA